MCKRKKIKDQLLRRWADDESLGIVQLGRRAGAAETDEHIMRQVLRIGAIARAPQEIGEERDAPRLDILVPVATLRE